MSIHWDSSAIADLSGPKASVLDSSTLSSLSRPAHADFECPGIVAMFVDVDGLCGGGVGVDAVNTAGGAFGAAFDDDAVAGGTV